MSAMSDSGSSGLSDWALVNSQGEVEGSEVASNTSSIEVIGVEEESGQAGVADINHGDSDSRESSLPECIELEQLMKAADVAAAGAPVTDGVISSVHLPLVESPLSDVLKPESLGACCPKLLEEKEQARLSFSDEEPGKTSEASSSSCTSSSSSSSSDSLGTDSSSNVSTSLSELASGSTSTKSDSDNESDFVRLERESSSTNVTESEGEEPQAEGEVENTVRPRVSLSTSGSSVGSGFNFLAGPRGSPPPSQAVAAPPLASLPPPPPPPPSPPHHLPLPLNPVVDAGDADTESSTEQDQDDRIESEQSDDANSAPPDDQDLPDLSSLSDIGDLPLVPGEVERHYVHENNMQLNIKLNYVVLTVVLVAFGLGLGHWIGSAREHFSQMEIQLAQMRRLHEMQDEYVQCLSRNDKLLVSGEHTLQSERDRHQVAMEDLQDNNRELHKQLQDAQDQLEELLTRQKRLHSTSNSDRVGAHGFLEKVTISELLFANDDEFSAMSSPLDEKLIWQLYNARQSLKNLKSQTSGNAEQSVSDQDGAELISARQHVNHLQVENEELRRTIARQRYEHHPGNPASAPPPAPIPPPPLACPSLQDVEDLRVENAQLKTELIQHQKQADKADKSEESAYSDDLSTSDGDTDYDVTIDVEDKDSSTTNRYQSQQTQAPSQAKCAPEPVPIDVSLLQRNLSQERQRADMWHRLYLSQHGHDDQGSKFNAINATACLHYLAQHMNASALMDYLSRWNVTGGGMDDFANLTYLLSSISELQHNLMQSLPSLWDQLSATLHDIHSDFVSDDEGTAEEGPLRSSDREEEMDGDEEKETQREGQESEKQRRWSDGVKSLLNKTRATMSNVSQHLQQTWGKVKEASQQLWPSSDSVISRMAARVTEGVTKFSHKLHKKATGWFNRSSKKKKWDKREKAEFNDDDDKSPKHAHAKKGGKDSRTHDHERQLRKAAKKASRHDKTPKSDKHGKPGKHEKVQKDGQASPKPKHEKAHKDGKVPNKHTLQHQPEVHEPVGDSETNVGVKPGHQEKPLTESKWKQQDGKQEKKDHKVPHKHMMHHNAKPDHHKVLKAAERRSQFHTHTKHHTVHGEVSAYPDKKLIKTFQKLSRRISNLNEHRFQRMDHDDREDLVEDLQEFQKHLGSNHGVLGDHNIQDWLRCQLKWWRQVEQQQYMAEDDCNGHLVSWQDALFDISRSRKSANKDDVDASAKRPDVSPKGEREDEDVTQNMDSGHKQNGGSSERTPTPVPDQFNFTTHEHPEWYFKRVEGRDKHRNEEHRADWVFDRASERDTTRQNEHDADWLFDRAAKRDASRQSEHEIEWLFERADANDDAHQEKDGVQHDHKKQQGNDYRRKYGKATCGFS